MVLLAPGQSPLNPLRGLTRPAAPAGWLPSETHEEAVVGENGLPEVPPAVSGDRPQVAYLGLTLD